MTIDTPQNVREAPGGELPRNWEDIKLPGGNYARIIFGYPLRVNPRLPREMRITDPNFVYPVKIVGQASHIGFENGIFDEHGKPVFDKKGLERYLNEQWSGIPDAKNENWLLLQATQKGEMKAKFYLIKPFIPHNLLAEDAAQKESIQQIGKWGGAALGGIAVVLLAMGLVNKPSRRDFLKGAGLFGFLGLGAASPFTRQLLRDAQEEKIVAGPTWSAVDKRSLLRWLEEGHELTLGRVGRLFNRLYKTRDLEEGLASLIVSEHINRMGDLAAQKGEHVAAIVDRNRMHLHYDIATGSKLDAQKWREYILKSISRLLDALEKEGVNTGAMRTSIETLPEVNWNKETGRWEATIHKFSLPKIEGTK